MNSDLGRPHCILLDPILSHDALLDLVRSDTILLHPVQIRYDPHIYPLSIHHYPMTSY